MSYCAKVDCQFNYRMGNVYLCRLDVYTREKYCPKNKCVGVKKKDDD